VGFAVIEHSLWQRHPHHLRKADQALHEGHRPAAGSGADPLCSWMGGDRDGNPNVTAAVTRSAVAGALDGRRPVPARYRSPG
jgi:phosphoenolpyruvate carboxylase